MTQVGVFLASVALGLALPRALGDSPPPTHCTSGCQPTTATRAGQTCAEIHATFTWFLGTPGACACQGNNCRVDQGCNVSYLVTFSVGPALPGCVFDRKVGGEEWGTTGYNVILTGCGVLGESREVAYSPTCDPNNITCKVTLDVYCSKCAGTCP